MNVQVLADPAGHLLWASDALPGATHDLTAARTHGIPAALAADNIKCWADNAYQGASSTIRVPFQGRNLRSRRRRHNRDHAKIRSLGERATATPEGLAAPAEAPLQHHPDHRRRPSRHCPRTRQLIKMGSPHPSTGASRSAADRQGFPGCQLPATAHTPLTRGQCETTREGGSQ
ncbi:hypothetical protein GCM10020295_25950 [Streptomyces cinereospinus]